MVEIQALLGELGLSREEAACYWALVELQEARTGGLCAESGVPSSHVYRVLASLMARGLVSCRVQNNVRVYFPASAGALSELFLERERAVKRQASQVAKLVASVRRRQVERKPYSDYKYFEGLAGVKAMWHEINEGLPTAGSSVVERVYAARKEGYAQLLKFYDEHHRIRNKAGVRAHILLPKEGKAVAAKRRNRLTQVRFAALGNEAEWGTVNGCLYVQYITGGKPRAFLIRDAIFANTFSEVFDRLWEGVRKAEVVVR